MRRPCRASHAGTRRPGTTRRRAPGSCRSLSRWWRCSHGSSRLELDQVAGGRADHDAAVVGDLHHVLDPHAADAGEVDPGLDGHDGTRGQRVVLLAAEARRLVDLEAHAVPETMNERLTVARALDDLATHGVDRGAGDARLHRVDPCLLRLADDIVDR